MKPYSVRCLKWSAGNGYQPAEGRPTIFVTAPSPKAAAVKSLRWRDLHQGDGFVRLQVQRLEEYTDLGSGPSRVYRVSLRAVVDTILEGE